MSEKRKRQATVKFRVDDSEATSISTAARTAGIPTATFARRAVIAAVKPVPGNAGTKSSAIALRDILSEINRIGEVTRKRAMNSADADRVVGELRRLQVLLFRFHYHDAPR
jgi:hypothetical protein